MFWNFFLEFFKKKFPSIVLETEAYIYKYFSRIFGRVIKAWTFIYVLLFLEIFKVHFIGIFIEIFLGVSLGTKEYIRKFFFQDFRKDQSWDFYKIVWGYFTWISLLFSQIEIILIFYISHELESIVFQAHYPWLCSYFP